ncbi:MAG: ABC transporter substrate-binding protein [Chloroflexi bacterium]|nr:ABC transporter substrate-binding protein [Chloroflexota bacterium]
MKRWMLISALLVVLALVVACAAPAEPTKAPAAPAATSAPAAATSAPAAASAKFAFWHSMGGTNGEAIAEMMKRFNAVQNKCVGEAVFQGSYDDSLNKLKAGLQSKDVPAVVQQFDLATQVLVDLQVIAPMQDFIDKDKFDLKDFEQNVLAYYSVGGRLYGMPYNTSNPMLYYNKDAFKAAGLDPNKPPRTYAEVLDYAKKLTKKGADGKVAMYGYSMAIYGWFFEQLLAASGGLYLDNGNGRDARATKATFNSPEGVKILQWWKEGYDAGVFGNFGRPTADTQKAFDAQQTAMMIESTAGLRSRLNAAQGKFELGTGFLPRPDEAAFQKAGTIIGGASVYIMKDRPAAEQGCAWEFVKFTVSPEIQAYWHTASGYYPVTKKSYDVKEDQEWVAKYPQFKTAVDQLHAAPNNRFTQGALTGVMPAARQRTELAIEEVIAAKSTPQQALDAAANDVTKLITDYNKTAPK